jgi:FtsP/CotA-like multicopper oxidase with cupredoxin domain
MTRREFAACLSSAALTRADQPPAEGKADFTLRIGPVAVELAPHRITRTTGYNGLAPGPLLRMKEGRPVAIDVYNDTGDPEIVHWHGLHIPSNVDGSMEEGSPMIPPHGRQRYMFTPAPAGTRWYHTHVSAGRNLKRGLYSGQFGLLIVDPKSGDPGNYDQEIFLTLREWDPWMSMGEGDEGSLDADYKYFSVNDRALGSGDPVRVKPGQRVLLRILNASATITRRFAFAGHKFHVVALDGNPVARPCDVEAVELGPAERIDALVEMNNPGKWILGATLDHDRNGGMGIIFEYAGQTGEARWIAPPDTPWDYRIFGKPPAAPSDAESVSLVFRKLFAGHRWVDKWSINGKSWPKTDPIRVRAGRRYRLIFDNPSDEAHPLHLHRHTFELTKVDGVATGGVFKDVVVVQPKTKVEAELVANNPGLSLFHCHQQMHMDYGFMAMMEYV